MPNEHTMLRLWDHGEGQQNTVELEMLDRVRKVWCDGHALRAFSWFRKTAILKRLRHSHVAVTSTVLLGLIVSDLVSRTGRFSLRSPFSLHSDPPDRGCRA